MNKTHKLTTVSMMIAITCALQLLDRQFGFIMADTIPVLMCSIIYYLYTKLEHQMAYFYGFCIILTSFILGNPVAWIYTISSVLGAVIVCKLLNNTKRIQLSILIFYIIEFIVSCLIYPLVGLDAVSGAKIFQSILAGETITTAQIFFFVQFQFSLLLIAFLETVISFLFFNVLKTRIK